ncbi:MAG: ribonuclease D [Alphaproteobacteria bacterium]|nr:ribonuclease D [Alphaproteobacteria bacterium]
MEPLTTQAALNTLCQHLVHTKPAFIALDTEFERETTYWPILCLLQLATPTGEVYVIDPLIENLDLSPLKPLFEDPQIIKVFHAARQDIEVILRTLDVIISPLFDTQIAAMMCGFGESIGYEGLVLKTLEVQVDKSARLTNWAKRPLTDAQLAYAAGDVIHLVPLYTHMCRLLDARARRAWAEEETKKLLNRSLYEIDPAQAWERVSIRTQTPLQKARLMRLAAWREKEAVRRNVPRSRLLKNEALEEIIQRPPVDAPGFDRIRALRPRPLSTADKETVLSLLCPLPGEDAPDFDTPFPRPAPPPLAKTVLAKALLAFVAKTEEMAPSLIALSKEIDAFCLEPSRRDFEFFKGWRHDIFGAKLCALMDGTLKAFFHAEELHFI